MAFLQVLVQVDLISSLVNGYYLSRPNKTELWIQFRYKRISEWCQRCGRLDHIQQFYFYISEDQVGPQDAFKHLKATILDSKGFIGKSSD